MPKIIGIYPKLPKVFKRRWLKALRSGAYEKGTGSLLKDGKYCCLGVACEIGGVTKITGHSFISGFKLPDKFPSMLEGSIGVPGKLADLNDSKRLSFNKIADWIEENL
jgi:hypothetical protein